MNANANGFLLPTKLKTKPLNVAHFSINNWTFTSQTHHIATSAESEMQEMLLHLVHSFKG